MFWRKIKDEPEEVLNWRLWLCAVVFGLMGAARGLDEGTISGTMHHRSFLDMVGMLDKSKSEGELAELESNIVAMVQIGCVGGSILAYLLSDRIGRLWSFWTLCVLWFIGVIIQITSFSGVGQIYAGRFIAGLGIGMTAVICPTYLVEISPANVRGLCACIYSGSVYLGVLVAQGANYAQVKVLQKRTEGNGSFQPQFSLCMAVPYLSEAYLPWRVPVGFLRLVNPNGL